MSTSDPANVYESADVVRHYKAASALQDCEAYVFPKYLGANMRVLDMGVGGGRTTPHLLALVGEYVGADYAQAMVDACRARFPSLQFVRSDAANMVEFQDASFDAMVFSFNGIDHLPDDATRTRGLREAARILRPGGRLVFSSHNAGQLFVWPQLRSAGLWRTPWRIVRAVVRSLVVAARTVFSGVYFRGEGYVDDPVHGGVRIYASTPLTMAPQLLAAGFDIMEIVRGPERGTPLDCMASWHYYVCERRSVEFEQLDDNQNGGD